jgi:hypothetical protein
LLQIALETLDRLSQVRQVLAKSDLTSITKRTNVVHLNPLLASETKLRDQFIELWWRLDLQDQPYGK